MEASERYKLMIYFAHSTLVFYSKSILCEAPMSVVDFKEKHPEVIQRVFDEALSTFNYELSFEQMNKAVAAYITSKLNPQAVEDTLIYSPTPA